MDKIISFLKRYSHYSIIFLFTLAYLFLSLTLHYRFNTTDADLAIYTQHVWFLSVGDWLGYGGTFKTFSIFGDHFIVHFFWIAQIMKYWHSASLLIVVQTLAITLSGLPVYWFAKEKLRDVTSASLIVVLYLLFYGYQAAEIFPFHGAALSSVFISFTLWFAYKRAWTRYFIFLVLAFFAKEDVPTFGFVLGLYLFFIRKDKKAGLVTSILSILYFYVVIFKIIPFYTHGVPYAYVVQAQNSRVTNPLSLVMSFFYPWVKVRTMLTLFGSFGFLPLVSPSMLLVLSPFLIARFTSDTIQRWLPWMHYSANQGAILGFGTVLGLENLYNLTQKYSLSQGFIKSRLWFYRLYLVAALLLSISISAYYKMPLLHLLEPDFYQKPAHQDTMNEALHYIPTDPNVSVATQSGFLPHEALRKKLYMYPHPSNAVGEPRDDLDENASIQDYAVPDADYILLSKYAYHWRPSNSKFDDVITYVQSFPNYQTIYHQDSTIVLKKISL